MSRSCPTPWRWGLCVVLSLGPLASATAQQAAVFRNTMVWHGHRACVQTGGRMAVALSGDGRWGVAQRVDAQRVDAESDPSRELLYAMSAGLKWPSELACLPPLPLQQPDDNGLTLTALSLSRNGRFMAVGGRGRPVQIFSRRGDRWVRESAIAPIGTAGRVSSGWGSAVALSGDGRFLVVADGDGRSGRIEGGVWTVNRRSGGAWARAVPLIWADMPATGRLGPALALSADGQTLAIGLFDQQDEVLLLRRSASGWQKLATVVQPLTEGRLAVELALAADGRWLAVSSGGPSADDVDNDLPPGQLALFEMTDQAGRLRGRWQSPDATPGDHFAQRLRFDRAGHVWALDPDKGRVCRYPLPHTADSPLCTDHREAPSGERVDPIPLDDFDVSDDGQLLLLGITQDPGRGLFFMLQRR